jgi:hypothetical protein
LRFAQLSGVSFPSLVTGVGHVEGDPVESLANVRGVDRESRNIDRPPGVTCFFQISSNSVEPTIPSLTCNLLSHDDRGPPSGDKTMEVGPQVPCIVNTSPFSCDREWLARAAPSPDRPVVGPFGKSEGVRPSSNPGKEVTLGKPFEVIRGNIDN